MLTRSSLTRSRQAQPSGSRMTSVQPWSVQGSRRSRRVSPPRSRRVSPPRSRRLSPPRSRRLSPPRSRRLSPPRSCRSDRSDRDRYGIILCARRPVGQRDRPRTRVEVSTSTGVSVSRPPPTAAAPSSPPLTTDSGASPSTSIKGATARPSRVIPTPSGKTPIKPSVRPAARVSASLGARSSPRSRLSLRGARPSAFDHNAGPLASSTSGKKHVGSSSAQFIARGLAIPSLQAVVTGREGKTPIKPSLSPANRAGPLAFTGHCSPLRGREAAEAAALLHTGLQLPIALSRGKRLADLIAKLAKDSEVAATPAEREAVASLSLKDMKTVIFFYYSTCEHQFLSYNVIVRGITMRMVHPKMTLKKELIAIRTRRCSDGGKKFDFLYAIALESALKGLATLLQIREEEECMDLDVLLGQSKTELLEWPLLFGSSHGRRKSN